MKTEKHRFHELKKTRIERIGINYTNQQGLPGSKRIGTDGDRVNVPYAITGVCHSPPWRAGPDSG